MTVELREISDVSVLGRSVWVGNCVQEVFGPEFDNAEFERWTSLWNGLPLDTYLHDHGRYRERRYAKLIYRAADGALCRTDETDFFQPRRYNPVNSGTRKFQPIDVQFLESAFARRLIRYFAKRFACELGATQLEVELHQVRIIGSPGAPGHVTPEGIHKDGVDFSCQILFCRRNASGGESIIYSNDKTPLLGATMNDPLDFYYFRDSDIYHSVTPISPTAAGAFATRDVLGLDFSVNRQKTEDES
ncbi:2OG-Fe dioxygenase family protein [Cupriavidus alkaliphilus]|uniref:2OG-Fe dioxygenase family protein n=1 Tax=Cupriavidus alkaliphilus TaxID=942866 RepID=UPI000DC436D5|nr:2OG-Fe dioxygenase family protein [Cupriavidus alkaliphilus]RAS01788.1 hypothetical protein C7415_11476 [Cupriavidus alkaliphilus]